MLKGLSVLLPALVAVVVVPPPPASAAIVYTYFAEKVVYDKNECSVDCATDPVMSYVYGYIPYDTTNDVPKPRFCCYTVSYRSSSGNGGPESKDDCKVNEGWIPNENQDGDSTLENDYNLMRTNNPDGRTVEGRVFYIRNAEYGNSVVSDCDADSAYERSSIIIHSEMTHDWRQVNATSGDDPSYWEGAGDYVSNGCNKLSWISLHNEPQGTSTGASGTFDWYWVNRGGATGVNFDVVQTL